MHDLIRVGLATWQVLRDHMVEHNGKDMEVLLYSVLSTYWSEPTLASK